MPRRKTKTRVEHLADALEAAMKAQVSLSEIDLRTTSGELRDALRSARDQAGSLSDVLGEALRADPPLPPKRA